jgi:CDP-2,3-bis-(O-geranylgeranyl)-sn-glycerol synthase
VDKLLTPLETVAVLLPALVANGAPVLLGGKGTPLDRGRRFLDGKPLLGQGKTIEGTAVALLYGGVVAVFVYSIFCKGSVLLGGLLSTAGAVFGDFAGSFLKRRLGIPRGSQLPVVDQLDFYMGAVALLYGAGLEPDPRIILIMAPIVFSLHLATNKLAYKAGLKSVPW